MPIKVVLLDDESHVTELLTQYCNSIEAIELKACFSNPADALHYINTHDIDLLVSDINMPLISGLDVVKSLTKQIKVIFITAHSEYAVDAYEVDVVDYIVKPVLLPRFVKAIGKVQQALNAQTPTQNTVNQPRYIFVKDSGIKKRILLDDILYLHAQGDYTEIFLNSGKLFLLGNLSSFEQSLPSQEFIRIHRSIIVNIAKVDAIDKDHLMIGNIDLTIGKTYRSTIEAMF
ncbi:LytR/AlgR family response regulator transcription factor [Thalassotalea marina]|uniref:DNA-binding response regulator n=1 Tax=Thalassotalea marina TaxID=1673741 RepID=A0A919EJI0_9GAMM|nr:LytTR family DNA-binding domain-containing protein [Thalassotalea marina]GHF91368.1 DNA-binding response regulator [Thalassotalea marina]